ncbi:hypothetical protein [Emticicia sp. 17c]|uniref:hypothetical protein n=1 Tax=Emticicia sp. 17c TaxID=3127704 RepID=UPI00301C1F55
MRLLVAICVGLLIFSACSPRNWHSNSHKDVYTYAKKVSRKPSNIKFSERLQQAYREQKDKILLEIESLQASDQPFRWEKIQDKYKILNEMAYRLNDCVACSGKITPVFYETEQSLAVRYATDERIETGLGLLAYETKPEAQRAYHNFMQAKKLSPSQAGIDTLINEALEQGTIRIVIEGNYKREKDYVKDIERDLFRRLPKYTETKPFYLFYNPKEAVEARLQPDYVITFGYDYLSTGMLQSDYSDESFSVDIKVGEKKVDSVKVVPVYEKVSAKVTRCKKSLKAEGRLWFEIRDFQRDEVSIKDSFYDDDLWVNEWASVSGDSRALPTGVISSGSELIPPSYWTQFNSITNDLSNALSWRIRQFLRQKNALAFR